jgi:HAD superfamily hydrolase (TIGR01549 family)
MIQAVLLDIDGTLLDSVDLHARAWHDILAHYGAEVTVEELRRQIGKGGDKIIPEYLGLCRDDPKVEAIGKERSELFQREYLSQVRPFPRVRELIERIINDGKRIILATSGKRDEVERYKQIAGIDDLVDQETTSDEADESKPAPDIFLAAMKRLKDVAVEHAIAVGDTPYDAQAACKIHLRTIGLTCGGRTEEELEKAGCIAVYRDPADLLEHYSDSPLGCC